MAGVRAGALFAVCFLALIFPAAEVQGAKSHHKQRLILKPLTPKADEPLTLKGHVEDKHKRKLKIKPRPLKLRSAKPQAAAANAAVLKAKEEKIKIETSLQEANNSGALVADLLDTRTQNTATHPPSAARAKQLNDLRACTSCEAARRFNAGRYEESAWYYQRYGMQLQEDSRGKSVEFADALFGEGRSYFKLNHYAKAKHCFIKALAVYDAARPAPPLVPDYIPWHKKTPSKSPHVQEIKDMLAEMGASEK